MSRETIKNGGVLKCDMPGCPSRFVTYSVVTKAREQAEAAGWTRPNGKQVTTSEGHILSTKKVDLCPDHKPKQRTVEMAPDVAASR